MATELVWGNFTNETKETLRRLRATFVMAPRDLSGERLVALVKTYLRMGNVVFGVAKEPYISGFEEQPQFRTLPLDIVLRLTEAIEKAKLTHQIHIVSYPQNEVDEVIRAIRPNRVVVVRGSYLYAFHRRSTYELLKKRGIPFEYASPFSDEAEAKAYLIQMEFPEVKSEAHDERGMFDVVDRVAKHSFDYSFQTGAALADFSDGGYTLRDAACNEVIPYQTYALHFGNSREDNLSPRHDANHYDTIHAEMNLLVRSMKSGLSFKGKSLFINMMPCPNCARTLVKTGLWEVVYQEVHSDGYAAQLFKEAGIKVRKGEV